jgi:gliding motility-associated-like protein
LPAATQASSQFKINNVQASGTVKVIYTSSMRCVTVRTATTSVALNAASGPEPVLLIKEDSTICVTSPITLIGKDNAPTSTTKYRWYKDGVLVSLALANATTGEIELKGVKESGSYILKADNGICAEVGSPTTHTLDVRQVPVANAKANGINPIEGFEGTELQLSGSYTGENTIGEWSADIHTSAIVDVTDMESGFMTANHGGVYFVTLTAKDGPCEDTSKVQLRIRIPLKAPNVFTANGDGDNEFFRIKGMETYPEASVTIFNRWGQVVYQVADNYASRPWDGGRSPEGVYYFIIELGESTKSNHSGVVHLIR